MIVDEPNCCADLLNVPIAVGPSQVDKPNSVNYLLHLLKMVDIAIE